MYVDYLHWQFVAAPRWLLTLAVTLQRALVRYFSVPLMLRTLFAYWRRDSVRIKPGLVSGIFMAMAWNVVSRVIGFIIRISMLAAWVCAAVVVAIASLAAVLGFVIIPFLIIFLAATGSALLVQ